MVTKSNPAATATKTPAAAPVDAAPQERMGRSNPLSAIMRMVVGKQPAADESAELAKFLSGALRLTDTHLYALAKFFSKRYHVQLSTLALKVARYQAAHAEGLSVQAAKSALEAMLEIQLAEYDSIEGNFSNEYERFHLEQVKVAHSILWDAYGRTGSVEAGLITLANAYDAEQRAQRQADMA